MICVVSWKLKLTIGVKEWNHKKELEWHISALLVHKCEKRKKVVSGLQENIALLYVDQGFWAEGCVALETGYFRCLRRTIMDSVGYGTTTPQQNQDQAGLMLPIFPTCILLIHHSWCACKNDRI